VSKEEKVIEAIKGVNKTLSEIESERQAVIKCEQKALAKLRKVHYVEETDADFLSRWGGLADE
jgi:hypothetical protein